MSRKNNKATRKVSKAPEQVVSAPDQVVANAPIEPVKAPEQVVPTTPTEPAKAPEQVASKETTPKEPSISIEGTPTGLKIEIPAGATRKEVAKTLTGILAAAGIASKGRSAKGTSKAVAPRAERPGRPELDGARSVREYCHRRILEGASDDTLRKELIERVGLPKEHYHYPSWYRNELVRMGKLVRVVTYSAPSEKAPKKGESKAAEPKGEPAQVAASK